MSQDNREPDGLGPLQGWVEAVKSEEAPGGAYDAARRNLLNKLDQVQEENPIMSMIKNSFRPGVRWATATGLAVLILAAVVLVNPFGRNAAGAYAAVAEQLRKAVTVSFSMQMVLGGGDVPTTMKIAYREPGLERFEMEFQGARMINIIDTANNKGVFIDPENKTGSETQLSSMPSSERDRCEFIKMMTRTVKELPEKAEGLGERTLDGRKVAGYRVDGKSLWIDVQNQSLVRVESQSGGHEIILSDFRLDPPELNEALFSTSLPAGYKAMNAQPIKLNAGNLSEQDLVHYLRLAAGMIAGHQFPSSINPMEILTLQRQGKLVKPETEPTQQDKEQFQQEFAQAAQRAMMFTMSMRGEKYDFHYAGGGVKLGDAKIPIVWWKPDGAVKYRVIWGDLRISDVESVKH